MFRGKQAHENDGGNYYWQHFQYQGVFSDMAARNRPYGGIFAKHRPIYTDHGVFIHYDPEGVTDMADGARKLVANFRYSKGPSTRHTGPSTLFRYLYQAGYDWLGAEQMYGPEESYSLPCVVHPAPTAVRFTGRFMPCSGAQAHLPIRSIPCVCICRWLLLICTVLPT